MGHAESLEGHAARGRAREGGEETALPIQRWDTYAHAFLIVPGTSMYTAFHPDTTASPDPELDPADPAWRAVLDAIAHLQLDPRTPGLARLAALLGGHPGAVAAAVRRLRVIGVADLAAAIDEDVRVLGDDLGLSTLWADPTLRRPWLQAASWADTSLDPIPEALVTAGWTLGPDRLHPLAARFARQQADADAWTAAYRRHAHAVLGEGLPDLVARPAAVPDAELWAIATRSDAVGPAATAWACAALAAWPAPTRVPTVRETLAARAVDRAAAADDPVLDRVVAQVQTRVHADRGVDPAHVRASAPGIYARFRAELTRASAEGVGALEALGPRAAALGEGWQADLVIACARVLQQDGRWAEARRRARDLLVDVPRARASACALLAECAQQRGNLAEATRWLDELAEHDATVTSEALRLLIRAEQGDLTPPAPPALAAVDAAARALHAEDPTAARAHLAAATSNAPAPLPALIDAARERLHRTVQQLEDAFTDEILVQHDPVRFRPPGGSWVSLDGRNVAGRLLLALAEQGGAIHPPEHLIEAVWPGEALLPASGRNRLYVAVRELRVAGLGDLLASRDGGYVLDAPVRLLSTSRTGRSGSSA